MISKCAHLWNDDLTLPQKNQIFDENLVTKEKFISDRQKRLENFEIKTKLDFSDFDDLEYKFVNEYVYLVKGEYITQVNWDPPLKSQKEIDFWKRPSIQFGSLDSGRDLQYLISC